MNNGRIEDIGAPERVYLRPASLFAATFMGDSNILTGTAIAHDSDSVKVETPLGAIPVAGQSAEGADDGT